MILQSVQRTVAAALTLLVLGLGSAQAQQATKTNSDKDSADLNRILAQMNSQVDIPEIPADQRATRAQIDQLFDSLHLRDQLDKTMQMMTAGMKGAFQQAINEQKQKDPARKELTPEEQKKFEALLTNYLQQVAAVVYSDEVMAPIKDAYQRYLTAADVEAITAFYHSPAGKDLVERQTKIGLTAAPAMMSAMRTRLQPLMTQMQATLAAIKTPPAHDATPDASKPTPAAK